MSKKRSTQKGKGKKNTESSKTNYLLPVILLSSVALLTIIAYVRSFNGPLIFDDVIYITPSKLNSITHYLSLKVRSVAELSFALNYYFWGMNLAAFRLTNILFHILTGFLVFVFTYTTLNLPPVKEKYGEFSDKRTPLYIALFAATLFLLHPIQTSAVNYITQRMAIMAGMFSFAGFIFYTKGVTKAGPKSALYYVLAGFSFVLAIFSKENAVMVLFMLPVYDLFFLSSFRWREFRKRFITLSVLMISLASVTAFNMGMVGFLEKVVTVLSNPFKPMERYGWAGADIQWTPVEYILTELRVVSRYIFLILFPLPSFMIFDYSNAYPVSKDLFHPVTTLLSFLFIGSLLVFLVKYIKRIPLISFGILWYLVTVSLESFIALGLDPYFEHRNYLPGFGLFLAIASLFTYADKFKIGVRKEAIISVVALLLFILTFTRNGVWTTEDLLWKDALKKSPNNARALINLSYKYIREKRFQEAEEYLLRASKVQPITDHFRVDVLVSQAALYRETNRRQEALAILKRLESDSSVPRSERGYVNFLMGDYLREEGDLRGAKEYLERAYENRRKDQQLLIVLGVVSRSLGETDKAEGYFKEAIGIDSMDIRPYAELAELGDIYLMRNDLDKAEENYREVVGTGESMPKNIRKRAFFGMAQIKLMKGQTDEAGGLFKEVIRIAPGYYPPYIFLGGIYLKKNDPDGALLYLEKALLLKETFMKNEPNTKLLYYYLGKGYFMKGDKKTARKNFDNFLSIAVGDKRLEKIVAQARQESAQARE